MGIQTLGLSWSTFGCRIQSSWVWSHKLCTPGFRDILIFFSADLPGGTGPFSSLCREVCLGSCQGSGGFTQGPSQLSQRPSPVVSAACLGPSSGFPQTRCSDLRIMFVPSCSQIFTFLIDGVQMDCWEPPEQQNLFYSSSVTAKSLNTHANVMLPFWIIINWQKKKMWFSFLKA